VPCAGKLPHDAFVQRPRWSAGLETMKSARPWPGCQALHQLWALRRAAIQNLFIAGVFEVTARFLQFSKVGVAIAQQVSRREIVRSVWLGRDRGAARSDGDAMDVEP